MARVEYVACPVCGMNRVIRSSRRLEKGKGEMVAFDDERLPSLDDFLLIQVREGGGKQRGASGKKGRGKAPGRGFALVSGLNLTEAMETGEYVDLLESLKSRVIKVVKHYIHMGIIEPSEILE